MEPIIIEYEFDDFTPNKVRYKEKGPSKDHKSGALYVSKRVFEEQGLEQPPVSIVVIVRENE